MESFCCCQNEGLVQTYARFILPSSVFQSQVNLGGLVWSENSIFSCQVCHVIKFTYVWQHGVFKEFCDHDSCGSGSNICYGSLCLVSSLNLMFFCFNEYTYLHDNTWRVTPWVLIKDYRNWWILKERMSHLSLFWCFEARI